MLLVGFVEGDGSFSVNIEIHISDIKLLYKIKSILGGFGSITTRKRTNTEVARLKISSKNDLISLPIFDKYGMLTNKQHDYLYFKSCRPSTSSRGGEYVSPETRRGRLVLITKYYLLFTYLC